MILALLAAAIAATTAAGAAQVRPLHTRDLTRLSQVQVADQLRHSDLIFVPVGAVETNGILPGNRDYIVPLAAAMEMARETGGLFVPGLMWSYPGTTRIAPSTIYLSVEDGVAQAKILARSLLRQGFRRQIWVSGGQKSAVLTVGTLARSFFEETHVPLLYIDLDIQLPRLRLPNEATDKLMFGAYRIAGSLDDLPLRGDYGVKESQPAGPVPEQSGRAELTRLGFGGSLTLASWLADVMVHGGTRNPRLPATIAEREAWGNQGAAQIADIVKKMRLPEAAAALREHDRFTRDVIVPKFGEILGPTAR